MGSYFRRERQHLRLVSGRLSVSGLDIIATIEVSEAEEYLGQPFFRTAADMDG